MPISILPSHTSIAPKGKDSFPLLERRGSGCVVKITQRGDGRVEARVKRDGRSAFVKLKGIPSRLGEENRGKLRKMLEGAYVRFREGCVEVRARGCGGMMNSAEEELPETFLCPITKQLMETPVFANCGHTFEKSALLEWLRTGRSNIACPICRNPIILDEGRDWVPNYTIKDAIDEWKQKENEPIVPRALLSNPPPSTNRNQIKRYEAILKTEDSGFIYSEYAKLLEQEGPMQKAAKAYLYLARLCMKKNEPEELESEAVRNIFCNPKNPKTTTELSESYLRGAKNAYQKAVTLQPENKDFMEEYAQYLEKIGKKMTAATLYEELIKLARKEELSIATVEKYHDKLIELQPGEQNHYKKYWHFLQKNGQSEKANEIKQRLLEITGLGEEMLDQEMIEDQEYQNEIDSLLNQIPDEHERIGMRNAIELLRTLKTGEVQQLLSIENRGPNDVGEEAWQAAFKKLTSVNSSFDTSQNLSGIKIGNESAIIWAKLYARKLGFKGFDLAYNQIGDEGAKAVAAMLKENQEIVTISLKDNQIGDEGAKAFAATLESNQTLYNLYLDQNQIGDEGVKAFAKMLEKNHTLQALKLDNNPIRSEGIDALFQALKENTTLANMFIRHNDAERIDPLLQANNQIAEMFHDSTKAIEEFIQSHQDQTIKEEDVFRSFQEQTQQWYEKIETLIPSLEEIAQQSGRIGLNEKHRERLENILTDLTQRLYNAFLNLLQKELMQLSAEGIYSGGDPALGQNLYQTWVKFFGPECPKWLIQLNSSLKDEVLLILQAMTARARGENLAPSANTEPIAPTSLFNQINQYRPPNDNH